MKHFIFCLSLLLLASIPAAAQSEPSDSIVYAPTDSLPDVEELEGVTVTAKKPVIQSEADRLIYNVDEDPAATTNSALEMMRKVPMLSVDGEDNVKLKGQENYKIYLNGKPDPTLSSNYKEVLRSMPASSIKKIEVITEPGAKYDAEGLGGIINIVTFSSARLEGYTVNIGANAGNTNANEYIYGTVKIGNVTLSANYSHGDYFSPSYSSSLRIDYENPVPYSHASREVSSKNHGNSNYGSLQMSWEPDTLNLFTLSANLGQHRFAGRDIGISRYADAAGDIVAGYSQKGRSLSNYLNTGVQANWQHNFSSTEHNLVLSYLYGYGNSRQTTENSFSDTFNYDPLLLLPQYNSSTYPSHEHTMQADYTHPFSKNHTLEVGGKYIIRNNYGESDRFFMTGDEWVRDEPNCVDMKQFQDVSSLYAAYTGRFGRFMAKAGLRYEFTHMGTRFHTPGHTDFSTDLHDPVPNALVSYKISDGSSLRASYRMQIQRPSVTSLNPTRNTSDPAVVYYGNPDLTSSRTHSVGLTYSNYAGALGGEIYAGYNRSSDLISQYLFTAPDGIVNVTYGNLGTSDGAYINGYLNWTIISGLKLGLNFGTQYAHYLCRAIELDSDGWGYNFNLNLDYDLPHNWNISAYGGQYKGTPYMQYKGSSYHWYGLSVSKSLLDRRLNISLSANDFFEPYYTYNNTNTGPGVKLYQHYRQSNWGIRLGVRLRLGSLSASVKQTAKSVSNDDVSSGGSGNNSGGK